MLVISNKSEAVELRLSQLLGLTKGPVNFHSLRSIVLLSALYLFFFNDVRNLLNRVLRGSLCLNFLVAFVLQIALLKCVRGVLLLMRWRGEQVRY